MSLTKIDISLLNGYSTFASGEFYSIYNPIALPGCIIGAFVKTSAQSVSAQVAARLAIEHFVEATTKFMIDNKASLLAKGSESTVLEVLEWGFREANRSVYDFGHKLAAGGRMGASLMGVVIYNSHVAVGRSDSGSVFIIRGNEIVPFFVEENNTTLTSDDPSRNLVGANSLVNVELSSLPLEAGDKLIVFSRSLAKSQEISLTELLVERDLNQSSDLSFLSEQLFSAKELTPVTLLINMGPDGIYLEEAV